MNEEKVETQVEESTMEQVKDIDEIIQPDELPCGHNTMAATMEIAGIESIPGVQAGPTLVGFKED